ncbi:MAG TPA: AAA family ATPase [Ktedonobacteraceae bacterium]|jgi:ATP-dependent Zn protease|nr:AAA family ATPase [Ktedonobacteraceae bacterium]
MTQQPKNRGNLDRAIDLGIDQFGRFIRQRWIWLVLLLVVAWYVIVSVVPQLTPPSPGSILTYAFQIIFAMFFAVIQIVALFWFLARPRLYWVLPGETGVSFDDYKGNPEVLEAARRIVTLIQGVKEFQDIGGQPIRGLLLTGDPGTGKSYLAQCMSSEAGVPFGYLSSSSIQNMFLGISVLTVSNMYRKARRLAREYGGCIIFMDEIDAIGGSRNGQGAGGMAGGGGMGLMGGLMGGGMGSGALNQLLMEMDPPNIETGWLKKMLRTLGLYHGRSQQQPVLTIGATNLPDTLDAALLRPGRFDRKVNVAPPTDKYRPEVIEYYIQKVSHEPDISINALSARLVNYTPVAIKHVVNEAVITAHFAGRDRIAYRDLIEAQDVHEYGLRQLSELTPIDRRRIAYHEAGHTVASYYLYERYFPAYVTVQLRSGNGLENALAFAHPRPKETVLTYNKQDIEAQIQVSMASRAAEELFLNIQMNGVTGDFAHATRLATMYVGAFGMDGTFTSFLAFAGDPTRTVQVPRMAERVEEVLQTQFKAAKQLLQDHSEALIAIAEALIERDELISDDIIALIQEADARQVATQMIDDLQPLLLDNR